MSKVRLLELDALRGIAAVAVVLYHYFYRYDVLYSHSGLYVDWTYYGKYGVQLFFIVSGFVIFWSLNRTHRPLDFVVSRFSRLYPAYWFALMSTCAFLMFFSLEGREFSFYQVIVNLTMVQEFLRVKHIDGVYWTLTVELIFYFWAFLFYIFGILKKIPYFLMLLLIVSVLIDAEFLPNNTIVYKVILMEHLPFFSIGICFYSFVHNDYSKKWFLLLFFALLTSFLLYGLKLFVLFLIGFSVFYLAVSGYLKFLVVSPLLFLGSVSYSLYLVHQNIGYIVINEFYDYRLSPLLGITVAFGFCLILSSIITFYIERPCLKAIRSIYYSKFRS